jgi:hypothetical protein
VIAAFLAVSLLTSAITSGQPASPPAKPALPILPGDLSIAGRVVEQGTDQGLAGAVVALASVDRARALVTFTDQAGRYAFTHIAAGAYRVIASHPGYVNTEFGLKPGQTDQTPRSGVITLERDVARLNVDLLLTRGVTVTGRVTRHDGRPVPDATVFAMWQGQDAAGEVARPPGAGARTDARGEYVLSNLPEGLYQISAVNAGDRTTRGNALTVYYPGTTSADERVAVKVSRSEPPRNIDIAFPASELLRISGKIVASDGAGTAEATIVTGRDSYPVKVAADGAFTTPDLRAGRYTLIATAKKDDEIEGASTPIDLVSDIDDLVMGLMPAGAISGRVVTDDGTPVPRLMQVAAVPADDGRAIGDYPPDRAGIAEDGRFVIRGVFGQRVMRILGVTWPWKVARMTVGKDEVTAVSIAPATTVAEVLIVLTRVQ